MHALRHVVRYIHSGQPASLAHGQAEYLKTSRPSSWLLLSPGFLGADPLLANRLVFIKFTHIQGKKRITPLLS